MHKNVQVIPLPTTEFPVDRYGENRSFHGYRTDAALLEDRDDFDQPSGEVSTSKFVRCPEKFHPLEHRRWNRG